MHNTCLYIILFFILTGCMQSEIILNREDYKLIDSLYNQEKEILVMQLDERCKEYQDSVLQMWVDSILIRRRAEIDKLINQ